MPTSLRRAAAAAAAVLAFALPAHATTYSTDYTDLWYNPAESGWGVNFIQQGQTMFATLFVYGVGNVAQWFTASALEPSPAGSQNVFTGQLIQTSGPYFGAPGFDPAAVTRVPVGTMTVTFTGPNSGTLQYSVNGALVTKSITRQSFRGENLTGKYLGGLTATGSACQAANQAGPILIFQTLNVQQSGSQVSMNVSFVSNQGQQSQCTFSGAYTPAGHLASVAGSWNCVVNGQAANAGSFALSEIQTATSGFTGKFHGTDQFCTYDGQFGGVRDVATP